MFLLLAALTSILPLRKRLETSTCREVAAASKLQCSVCPRAELGRGVWARESHSRINKAALPGPPARPAAESIAEPLPASLPQLQLPRVCRGSGRAGEHRWRSANRRDVSDRIRPCASAGTATGTRFPGGLGSRAGGWRPWGVRGRAPSHGTLLLQPSTRCAPTQGTGG